MEPIKITDKVTLRQEALRLSVATGTAYPISQAKQFEAYLLNDAELPEYEDTHKDFKEMLGKFQDSFKPNPWISADSEMKPYEDTIVLVRCEGYENPQLGKYLGADYWEVRTETLLQSKLNEVNVLAWMPIPPFTQPNL